MLEVGDCGGDRFEQGVELVLELLNLGINDLLIHLPARFLINQVIMNVLLFRQPLHIKGHLLLVHKLSDIDHIGGDIMATELFFQ